jgi:hypothetical protein
VEGQIQEEHNKRIILKVDLLQHQEIITINKPIILKVVVQIITPQQVLVTTMEINRQITIKVTITIINKQITLVAERLEVG